jgi:hypothetical protein
MGSDDVKSDRKTSPNGKVAKILAVDRIVINRGTADGVGIGDTYIIYELGEAVLDPDTQEDLGKLQIIKGRAAVVSVQGRLAVLDSIEYEAPDKFTSIFSPLVTMSAPQKIVKPFADVKVGDLAYRSSSSKA